MKKTRPSSSNVIRFPTESVAKFGLQRVKKRRKGEDALEAHGQLNLFTGPARTPGEVVKLPTGIGPFDEALLLDEQGSPDAATAYRRAIDAGDSVADAYCNLGVMESRAGNTAAAFDCFKSALKHDPRHFESHYNLGNLYLESGDLRPARLHYELASELDPDFSNVYFNLGLVSALADDYTAAIEALTTFQSMVPDDEARKADELLARIKATVPRGQ